MGGLFCDFEPFRTASGPSRRVRDSGRVDGVFTRHRRHDAVVVIPRESTGRRRRDATSDRVERPRCSAQVDNRVFALIVFGMYCVTVFFIILSMFFAMVSAAQARTSVKLGHDRRGIPSST